MSLLKHTVQIAGIKNEESEPVAMPIDGTLDLHTFQPQEVKSLIIDYLSECQRRGIFHLRIIHGKGTGAMRETVHRILGKIPEMVESFRLADETGGGWGATEVQLKP